MSRYRGSVCRQCRRENMKLFLKGDRCFSDKCSFDRRGYPPGQHGQRRSKHSDYGIQLREKQKVRRIYGISEKQFRKHLAEAAKKKGVIGDNLITRLEMRFDNVIYRLGIASSRAQARQLVSHAMFVVNGKNLNVPSAELKAGDEIVVKEQKLSNSFMKELQIIMKKKHDTPSWLNLEPKTMNGKILSNPPKEDLGVGIDTYLVIEFYSR